MKRKLFNFFVIGAFFAIIFTACGHKPSLDGLENMIIPKPVKVTWSPASSADTEIKVGRQNSAGHVFNLLQSGDEVYTGLKLWINASRKTKALDRDKTTINGKSIKDIGSDIAGLTMLRMVLLITTATQADLLQKILCCILAAFQIMVKS